MQTEFTFKSSEIEQPSDFFSIQKVQLVLTLLSLAVAFFAILELSIS
ncbi:MAG: hypothetical protein WCV72_05095 [Patescibacteria group bacterium]